MRTDPEQNPNEDLSEGVERHPMLKNGYLENPSPGQIMGLLNKASTLGHQADSLYGKSLRWVAPMEDDSVYFWDASEMIHTHFLMRILGYKQYNYEFVSGIVTSDPGEYRLATKGGMQIEKGTPKGKQKEYIDRVSKKVNSKMGIKEEAPKMVMESELVGAIRNRRGGNDVLVYENPVGSRDLAEIPIQWYPGRVENGYVRFVFMQGTLYAWDGWKATHEEFIASKVVKNVPSSGPLFGQIKINRRGQVRDLITMTYSTGFGGIDQEWMEDGAFARFAKKRRWVPEPKSYASRLFEDAHQRDRETFGDLREEYHDSWKTQNGKVKHIFKNISKRDLFRHTDGYKNPRTGKTTHDVRFVIDSKNDLYAWDGYYATHEQMLENKLIPSDSRMFGTMFAIAGTNKAILMTISADAGGGYKESFIPKATKKWKELGFEFIEDESEINEETKVPVTEGLEKHPSFKNGYLENPSAGQVVALLNRANQTGDPGDAIDGAGLRWIMPEGSDKIYFWDAFEMIHTSFLRNILGYSPQSVNRMMFAGGIVTKQAMDGRMHAAPGMAIEYKGNMLPVGMARINRLQKQINRRLEESVLKESVQKHPKLSNPYLENPTPKQVVEYLRKHKNIRMLETRGTVYCWNAEDTIHIAFMHSILGMSVKDSESGYRRDPSVWVETDGEFMYSGTNVRVGSKLSKYGKAIHDYAKSEGLIREEVLTEGLVKHPKLNYLENPSPGQIVALLNKANPNGDVGDGIDGRTLRWAASTDGNVYFWDAYEMIHGSFMRNIVGNSTWHPALGKGLVAHPKGTNYKPGFNDETYIHGDEMHPHATAYIKRMVPQINSKVKALKEEVLTEEYFDGYKTLGGKIVDVYKNPSFSEIIKNIDINEKSSTGNRYVRFIHDRRGDLYCWDAYHSTHHAVMSRTGVKKTRGNMYGQLSISMSNVVKINSYQSQYGEYTRVDEQKVPLLKETLEVLGWNKASTIK